MTMIATDVPPRHVRPLDSAAVPARARRRPGDEAVTGAPANARRGRR
ncbi:hypothetical protein JNW88_30830 [Micromonospora sp. ATA32]|nr:hypothetical protein [Micromonospora sp. ATA32]